MRLSRRQLLWGAAGLLGAGVAGAKLLRGFEEDSPEAMASTLPPSLRRAALDVHVHVLGTGAGGTGCWINPATTRSLPVRAGLWIYRLSLAQPDLDSAYIAYLRSRLLAAGFLKQAVLLAQDWTYSEAGQRLESTTPFYTPNDYVAALAAQFPEFLFGASIHPYRPDALDELDRVAARGAVLLKWIPNVQLMDPASPRCRPFLRRLAALRMPLLCHTGDERAIAAADPSLGDPRRLQPALEAGVTVIAAHVASLGERDGRSNMDLLLDLMPRWPNLFADTSALTLVFRWRALKRVIEEPRLRGRLVHGSDFPLPPASTMYFGQMPLGDWWNAWKRENPFLRDFLVKQAMGMSADVYTRGYEVLAPRIGLRPAPPAPPVAG